MSILTVMDEFTAENDEQLIHLVSNHPELYDPKNQSYKLTLKKDVTWKAIAEIMNKSAASCKKRWKNIRDNYYKQKKKATKTTGSAGSGKRRRNPVLDQLGFLEAVEHERRLVTSNNLTETDHCQEHFSDKSSDESMEANNTHTPTVSQHPTISNEINKSKLSSVSNDTEFPVKKRKKDFSSDILKAINRSTLERENLIQQITAVPPIPPAPPEDEIDSLFKSLAMTVKSFPALLRAETKSKIFQIISDAEIQLLRHQPTSSRLSTYSYETSTPLPSSCTWDQQDLPSGSDTSQYFGNFRA